MRRRYENLICAASISVWFMVAGMLQPIALGATNQTQAVSTNSPSPLVQDIERLEAHPLTFGLDQVRTLREVSFLGEPLWKYVASLIYILLAFFAAKLIDFIARVWLSKIAS